MVQTLNIDRYETVRLLGQGAMGKVYLAKDPKLGRDVAIKLLASDAGEDVRHRFRLEARAIAALKHPNIIEIYDYSGETAQDLYLVLEYIPGRDLFEWAKEHGVDELTALCVGHELALALQHAHAHAVVHRDIKPENILLHHGRVVLSDFGAVKAFASSRALGVSTPSPRTQAMGTPGFMAPEQFEGVQVGPASDLFGVGATLYNVTTGRLPYSGGSMQELYETLKAGRYVDPTEHKRLLSPDFCRLLAKLLAPKPKDRFKDASALREAIEELLSTRSVTDVRQHICRYEESPAQVVVEQREREAEEILRDLKVALKDRDPVKVRTLARRLEVIAPLDKRMKDLSGFELVRSGLSPVRDVEEYRRLRRRWWAIGGLVGALVGFGAGAGVGSLYWADVQALLVPLWALLGPPSP